MSGSSERDSEGGQGSSWVAGVVAQGGGDVAVAAEMQDADGEVADSLN